jgi:hypothetical protein
MEKTKRIGFGTVGLCEIPGAGVQQMKRTDDIGMNEWGGTFDRSIDVTLCCQMQDSIGLKALKKIEESSARAKIQPLESIIRMPLNVA